MCMHSTQQSTQNFSEIISMKMNIFVAIGIGLAAGVPLTPGGPYATNAGPRDGMINVHLVSHTHDDVGWLKTVNELYLGANNQAQISAVQYILDSVIDSLSADPNRKFIYAEMAFFSRWWRRQNDLKRAQVLGLIKSGQLEFINGGWTSNDEATPTFVDIIDQHTMGATYIAREFGCERNPTVGWQVDPFGHSLFQARAYSEMGMDSWFFGRSDAQDFKSREATRRLESVHSGILAGSMNGYGPPPGFDWNVISGDEPLNDDPYLGTPNIEERVDTFVKHCLEQADAYNFPNEKTQHIMLTMGSDFEYEYAHTWFSNLDKLIHYVNLDGRVNAFYSTPSAYTASRAKQDRAWKDRSDYDWFPYCDSDQTEADEKGKITKVDGHAYWTGYFTSRPWLKKEVREASAVLEACRIAEIVKADPGAKIEDIDNPVWLLWEALSVVQHHDGVSGTEREKVAVDYAQRLRVGIGACKNLIESATLPSPSPTGSVRPHRPTQPLFYESMLAGNGGRLLTSETTSHDDGSARLTGAMPKVDGINVYLAYYNSSTGNKKERPGQASGAYIFRPDCPEGNVAPCRPTRLPADCPWAQLRVFPDRVEWEVGPIPQDNGAIGKEVVLVIEAKDINNKGTFFTDANGYQWMERTLNSRSTWDYVVTDPVSGNYYPITAGIAIRDGSGRSLVVTPDRSVGGSSLENGQIEIMVHRRLFIDDMRGVDEPLDEKDMEGKPIVVRGTTWYAFHDTLGSVPTSQLRPIVPLGQLEPAAANQLFTNFVNLVPHVQVTHVHRVDVPELCKLGDHDCILLRIRNLDTTGDVKIDLRHVLRDRVTLTVTATVLNAGKTVAAAAANKIHWTDKPHVDEDRDEGMTVKLGPGEMRTFILETELAKSRGETASSTIETV